jgi:O-antigen ligase
MSQAPTEFAAARASAPPRTWRSKGSNVGLALFLIVLPLAITRFTADPFQDAKLVVLLGASLLLWLSLMRLDRVVSLVAGVFVGVMLVAALAGVDVATSLTISGYRNSDAGFMVYLAAAALAVIGASLGEADTVDRARRFLIVGGVAVAVMALAFRVEPSIWNVLLPGGVMRGATLGHPVFAAAFLSAAIGAALGNGKTATMGNIVAVGVLTFGAVSLDQRNAVILPLVVAIVWAISARAPRRAWLPFIGVILGVTAVYQLVLEPVLPQLGASTVEQFAIDAAPDARFRAWGTIIDGTLERPLTGWGPGTTLTAYTVGGAPGSFDEGSGGWSDAHDLLVEVVAGAGLLGGIAVLGMLGVLAWRCVRVRVHWALAGSAALLAFALLEPINVVTTPLLFFLAGIAGGPPGRTVDGVAFRRVGAAFLAIATLVACSIGAAALAEKWGTRYQDRRAVRLALAIQPWRSSATYRLGTQLAHAEQAGEVSVADVRDVIAGAVGDHPWDPVVRWWAASIELEMGNEAEAVAWLEAQRAMFPAESRLIDDAISEISAQ